MMMITKLLTKSKLQVATPLLLGALVPKALQLHKTLTPTTIGQIPNNNLTTNNKTNRITVKILITNKATPQTMVVTKTNKLTMANN